MVQWLREFVPFWLAPALALVIFVLCLAFAAACNLIVFVIALHLIKTILLQGN